MKLQKEIVRVTNKHETEIFKECILNLNLEKKISLIIMYIHYKVNNYRVSETKTVTVIIILYYCCALIITVLFYMGQ